VLLNVAAVSPLTKPVKLYVGVIDDDVNPSYTLVTLVFVMVGVSVAAVMVALAGDWMVKL
jgi:hypothetical protein